MSFLRKVALVTGGARGFGKAFGREVLENGGKVSLLDVITKEGSATAAEFNKEFGAGSAAFIKCDVSNKQELANAFQETKETFGHIDIVINNAGIAGTKGLDSPQWEKVLDIDLTAVVHGNILAKQYLSKDNGGRGGVVVNIASAAGLTGVPAEPVYAAAKHGVVGLSRSVAPLFEDLGIKVGCLCPTFVKTDLVTGLFERGWDDPAGLRVKAEVKAMGFVKISEVVRCFRHIVESEETGMIIAITPMGTEVKLPKHLKGKL